MLSLDKQDSRAVLSCIYVEDSVARKGNYIFKRVVLRNLGQSLRICRHSYLPLEERVVEKEEINMSGFDIDGVNLKDLQTDIDLTGNLVSFCCLLLSLKLWFWFVSLNNSDPGKWS